MAIATVFMLWVGQFCYSRAIQLAEFQTWFTGCRRSKLLRLQDLARFELPYMNPCDLFGDVAAKAICWFLELFPTNFRHFQSTVFVVSKHCFIHVVSSNIINHCNYATQVPFKTNHAYFNIYIYILYFHSSCFFPSMTHFDSYSDCFHMCGVLGKSQSCTSDTVRAP